MKLKSIGLLLILLFTGLSTFSQFKNFNLSDYKLPDLKRKSLDLEFDLSGGSNFNTNMNDDKYTQKSFSGNFDLVYRSFHNNSRVQQESFLRFATSYRAYNNMFNDDKTIQNLRFYTSINFQKTYRNYFKEKKFYELDFKVYGNSSHYKDKDFTELPISDERTNYSTYSILLPIKIGKGRIEQVQDARLAVYIVEALNKENRLNTINNKEIFEIAELISQLKNKRFFDSRIRKAYELEAIDSLFRVKNYVTDHDSRYFTTLLDMWEFGGQPFRSSGTRISAAIYPGYYRYSSKFENENYDSERSISDAFILSGGLEVSHEKPLNLYWQHSLGINANAGLMLGSKNERFGEPMDKERAPNMQLGLFNTFGYYPNTRTHIRLALYFDYIQIFDKTNEEKNIKGFESKYFATVADLSAYYYFSPKLKISFNYGLNYNSQDSPDGLYISSYSSHAYFNNFVANVYRDNHNLSTFTKKRFRQEFNISLTQSIY